MNRTTALSLLWTFTILGLLLSGYLSYVNIWGQGCTQGLMSKLVSCGSGPKKVLIFGQPTCIYGFFMYLAGAVTLLLAIGRKNLKPIFMTTTIFGIAGTLFSGFLVVYELWVIRLTFDTIPSCAYGLVLYLGILITSMVALKGQPATQQPGQATPPQQPLQQ